LSEPLSSIQLKKRLLGAAILVLVAAIVIPFLLGEPKQMEVQPQEKEVSTEFQSKIQPLNPSPQAPVQQNTMTAPEADTNDSALVLKKIGQIQPLDHRQDNAPKEAAKIEPLRLDTLNSSSSQPKKVTPPKVTAKKSPAKKTPVKKTPAKKAPAVAKTVAPKSGWAVQVGIFSQSKNAEAFAGTLKGDGYRPKVSNAKTSSGKVNKRVWLGPFSSKKEAKAISDKFERQTGNDGYVAPYPFKS